jgi:hypothetical protein
MTSTRRAPLAWTALTIGAVFAVPARAGFTPIAQPDAAYKSGTSLFSFAAPDFDVVSSLTNGPLTITPDIPLVALTVPGTWSSWGSPPNTESATPRVLWTNGLTSVTLTSSSPLTIFGLEAQPDTTVVSPLTASFFDNNTLIGQIVLDVDGVAGARLFAGLSTVPFNRVVLSSPDDFAVSRIRASAVPEPSLIAMLVGACVLGMGGRLRRWARKAELE